MSPLDYFERGLHRRRRPLLPIVGDPRADEEDRRVRFSLSVADGVIDDVVFEATTCPTLIAFCEVLAERVQGHPAHDLAALVHPDAICAALPGIPPYKRNLALLASTGFLMAAGRALSGETT